MNIKKELIDALKKQLQVEIISRELYIGFLKKLDNANFKKIISKIIEDEERHIEIVNEMIKIVEEYKKEIVEKKTGKEKTKEAEKELKIGGIFKEANSVLFLSSVDDYMFEVKHIIKNILSKTAEKKIIYVSYNKIPKYTKKLFKEDNINLNKIFFINCVGTHEGEDINLRPEEITTLAITIENLCEKIKNPVIIVDTVSAFSVYNPVNTITRFVSSINDKARERNYYILWVAIDDEDEKNLNGKLKEFCDAVLKV
jgi:rubrerythrin